MFPQFFAIQLFSRNRRLISSWILIQSSILITFVVGPRERKGIQATLLFYIHPRTIISNLILQWFWENYFRWDVHDDLIGREIDKYEQNYTL